MKPNECALLVSRKKKAGVPHPYKLKEHAIDHITEKNKKTSVPYLFVNFFFLEHVRSVSPKQECALFV